MAGVHSPSDAFAHLQHYQHNGLLGPSMQVRGPRTSLTSSTAHCNPCQCIVVPLSPANPIHFFPVIHKTVRSVGIAWLSYLVNCFGMRSIALQTVQVAFKLYISVSVTHLPRSKLEKAFSGWCYSYCKRCHILSMLLVFYFICCLIDTKIIQRIQHICMYVCFCSWCYHSDAAIRITVSLMSLLTNSALL